MDTLYREGMHPLNYPPPINHRVSMDYDVIRCLSTVSF